VRALSRCAIWLKKQAIIEQAPNFAFDRHDLNLDDAVGLECDHNMNGSIWLVHQAELRIAPVVSRVGDLIEERAPEGNAYLTGGLDIRCHDAISDAVPDVEALVLESIEVSARFNLLLEYVRRYEDLDSRPSL
jgi:hypothetical protein